MVYIKSGALTYKLSWMDILYLEKAENYVIYHTKERRILSRQTLSDLENYFSKLHLPGSQKLCGFPFCIWSRLAGNLLALMVNKFLLEEPIAQVLKILWKRILDTTAER